MSTLEHVPEIPGTLIAGLTYCKRCGLLLAADTRPDLDPNRKPCRVVRVGPRCGLMSVSLMDTYVQDMQAALRALWPDRPVVYFTEASAAAAEHGPGPVLTDDERDQLSRVAAAIGSARAGEED